MRLCFKSCSKALRARINDFRKEEEIALLMKRMKIVALPGNENLKLPVLK